LIAIADYFNVSLDYLTGRSDNPKILWMVLFVVEPLLFLRTFLFHF
jgi:uncharacterized integral membrane protein